MNKLLNLGLLAYIMAMPLIPISSAEAGKCGPELDITLDADQRNDKTGHKLIGREYLPSQSERSYSEFNTQDVYGSSDDEDTDYGIQFRIRIPLGEDYCTEQEAERYRNDKARAYQAELNNIEKTLKLCKQYGVHHPLLEGKCF